MSIEDIMAAIEREVEQDKNAALQSSGQMTLGKLIECFDFITEDTLPVQYQNGASPGEPHSYRGYYSDLAFDYGEPTTVAEFRTLLRNQLGKTYTGYKGGSYLMDASTWVWRSEWGSASGLGITEVHLESDRVVLRAEVTA